jgi:hypothetical protein
MFPIFNTAYALILKFSSGDTAHSRAAVIGASLGQLSADIPHAVEINTVERTLPGQYLVLPLTFVLYSLY